MINLLPDGYKQDIRAARTNVLLVRYIFILISALILITGLIAGTYIVLDEARQSAQQQLNENTQRTNQYQTTRQRADEFRKDLATAKTIMDQKVSFSKLIYKIANATPPNVILDSLSLDPATFGTKINVNASARTFSDATKLKDAYTKSTELFSSVQLQSIQSNTDGETNGYPIKIILSVAINKGAAQ